MLQIYDLGIQLYLAGVTGSTAYKDVGGVSHTLDPVANLLGTSYVAGPVFQCGLPQQLTLSVIMRYTNATSITLKLERSRVDSKNNPTLWPDPPTLWEIVQLSAQDDAVNWTGSTIAAHAFMDGSELAFVPAAPPAGPGHLAVITTAIRAGQAMRLSAKAVGAGLTANDYIIVGVNA